MDVKAYAASVGRAQRTVANEVWAAEVAAVADVGNESFSQLVEIHAAPKWLWAALVNAMVEDGLDAPQGGRQR